MPLDLASRTDPLLEGISQIHFETFDPDRASRHVSAFLLRRHGQARLFVADCLLKLWASSFVPIRGDKRLGRPHMLNNQRFKAVAFSLDEYSPKQIANAIRAYAAHCRTNAQRVKNPEMRKTFDGFLTDVLETWVSVGEQLAKQDLAAAGKVADLQEHQRFLDAWSCLSPAHRRDLMMRAIGDLDRDGVRYGSATTADPAVRSRLWTFVGQVGEAAQA